MEEIAVTRVERGIGASSITWDERAYYEDMLWAPQIDWIQSDKKV